jgi:type II secretory ATPase GspE/PulE/Tfp pilus assembly ATPase PilB-like protein
MEEPQQESYDSILSEDLPQTPLNMDFVQVDPYLVFRIPASLALRKQVLPICLKDDTVYLACLQKEEQVLHLVQRHLGHSILPQIAEPESLYRAIQRFYGSIQSSKSFQKTLNSSTQLQEILSEDSAEQAVSLAEELLGAAILKKASDLHLLPYKNLIQVRLRVDGELENYCELPRNVYASLVSRFKVLSRLDISEKRISQDGGFQYTLNNQDYDIRVATLPLLEAERLTLRFLPANSELLSLSKLGMSSLHLSHFSQLLKLPEGLILLTGPTGSGKTTTLYAAIQECLKLENTNIISVEDPIEYKIPGISQVRVDSHDKVNFSKALRSIFRHDPDIVIIGEIRDQETAEVTIKASLTGHLVFSTLHTNSSAGAITRLEDMHIPRYLIGSTLKASIAQRLTRRLCEFCKAPTSLSSSEAQILNIPEKIGHTLYQAKGCLYCGNQGYSGRFGIFEMLCMDEINSKAILQGCREDEILEQMRSAKIPLLFEDSVSKLLEGKISLKEVLSHLPLHFNKD